MEESDEQEKDNNLDQALEEIIKKTEEMEKRIEAILSKQRRKADR